MMRMNMQKGVSKLLCGANVASHFDAIFIVGSAFYLSALSACHSFWGDEFYMIMKMYII